MINRKWYMCLTILYFLLFISNTVVAKGNNYSTKLFPLPKILKPNVEFWIKIYSKYSERDIVIHDAENLSIIYKVVNLDSLFRGIQVSERLKWRKIERIKKDYKSILLKLSKRKKLKLEALHGKEKYVASLFRKELKSRRLRRAAYNIRAQNGLKDRFKQGMVHSGLYMSKMRQIFNSAGLPEELLVLPHVESSFNYKAYSKFGAAGIWQFTRSTGRRYLKINYNVDERLDPIRATEAAAKLLKRNFQDLGTWPMAITAYNHGLYGMKRAKRIYGTDLGKIIKYFKSRSFGFASRNFYAEFLAASYVVKNYQTYFGEFEFHKPADYVDFETPHYIKVNTLIRKFNIDFKEFAELNPALRPPVLHSKRRIPKNFKIRLPFKENLNITELYAQISPEFKFNEQIRPTWHKVRRGETLSSISRKYQISLNDLLAYNDIDNAHLIYVGQKLRILSSEIRNIKIITSEEKVEKETQLAEATNLKTADTRKISKFDMEKTLPSKKKMNANYMPVKTKIESVDVEDKEKSMNPIEVKREEQRYASLEKEMAIALPNFYVEMTRTMDTRIVRVPHKEKLSLSFREIDWPENGQVKVEPDETLGHFADWLEVPTQKLRAINGLRYGDPIRIGQHIWLTFEKVTPEEFHRRRIEYHQGIEEDFYSNFNVEGIKIYRVKRGENIWIISNRIFEVPYWLIKKYNPDQDLFNLVAGDEIVIPIVVAKNSEEIFAN
ncbi:MAG: LysM peptidoglycan-binding domain-containing protein [bacterium]